MVGAVACVMLAGACTPPPPGATTRPPRPTQQPATSAQDPGPIMAASRLSAAELTAWFWSRRIAGARPPVPVSEIARYFIEEGAREGVAGDVAFVQAILETGWFRFSERTPPHHNNFAGIGAVDGGSSSAAFRSARIGVRAQIQHLRAYADPTTTCSNFATARVTPRCHLVTPKGKSPNWADMGAGNWATDPGYATKIATLYRQASEHARTN